MKTPVIVIKLIPIKTVVTLVQLKKQLCMFMSSISYCLLVIKHYFIDSFVKIVLATLYLQIKCVNISHDLLGFSRPNRLM